MYSEKYSPSAQRVLGVSSSSVPKMDLSRSTLRVMAGGIYRMLFPSGFRDVSGRTIGGLIGGAHNSVVAS
jgi:hypothetical protein